MFTEKQDWRERIARILDVPVERVHEDRKLEELVVDSFAYVEMALALQEASGIRLSQADLQGIRTVGDLLARLDARAA